MAATFTPGWDRFPPLLLEFWTERHLCTLTTLYADGRPHVVPVGVVLDHEQRCAWVITSGTSAKARHLTTGGPVAASQVDGRRWATLEGTAEVQQDPTRAVEQYAARYRQPRPNPERVALRIEVERFLYSEALAVPPPSTG